MIRPNIIRTTYLSDEDYIGRWLEMFFRLASLLIVTCRKLFKEKHSSIPEVSFEAKTNTQRLIKIIAK